MDPAILDNCRAELQALWRRLSEEVQSGEKSIVEAALASGDGSHLPTHVADHDSGAVENNMATTQQQSELLQAVAEALDRMAIGSFGQCQICGGSIAPLRLEAIPYTPYCFPCAQRLEDE